MTFGGNRRHSTGSRQTQPARPAKARQASAALILRLEKGTGAPEPAGSVATTANRASGGLGIIADGADHLDLAIVRNLVVRQHPHARHTVASKLGHPGTDCRGHQQDTLVATDLLFTRCLLHRVLQLLEHTGFDPGAILPGVDQGLLQQAFEAGLQHDHRDLAEGTDDLLHDGPRHRDPH